MKKIALITMHKANNYGAVLQAFATQYVLSKNADVYIVDYENELVQNNFKLLRFDFSIHGLKMFIHDIIRLPWRKAVIRKFKQFFNNKYKLTQSFNKENISKKYFENFDAFVSGSDQIWNPNVATKNGVLDENYFLSFAPNNAIKLSYASSIGSYNYKENEKILVQSLLKSFTSISVREYDGVLKLNELLPEKNIENVLDPTLLLTHAEWLNAVEKSNINIDFPYILVYSVPRTQLIKNVAEYYKNKLGYKVVLLDQLFKNFCNADLQIRSAGIEDFIHLFNNASFVITDSFHGTCFALNFNKPFVSIAPHGKKNRIENLLNQIDLQNNIIDENSDMQAINIHLDYNILNPKIELVREKSFKFIENALKVL